jgi:L-fuconate dehydratase
MSNKFGIPICTHSGGVGLCQMAAHLAAIDYICISNSTIDRITEYVDHLQEHFEYPINIQNGNYQLPKTPGIGLKLKENSILNFKYPDGLYWKNNYISEVSETIVKC